MPSIRQRFHLSPCSDFRSHFFSPLEDLLPPSVDVPLDTLVIALELAIGLRVERRGQNVLDSHQVQVVSEATGDIT